MSPRPESPKSQNLDLSSSFPASPAHGMTTETNDPEDEEPIQNGDKQPELQNSEEPQERTSSS